MDAQTFIKKLENSVEFVGEKYPMAMRCGILAATLTAIGITLKNRYPEAYAEMKGDLDSISKSF